jgi:hypothetical protein
MTTYKGIERVAQRFCVQTCVYWGNPQNDGYGHFTYDDPVEILCRWEDTNEVNLGWFSSGFPGNILLSKSNVMVLQDVDLQGYLYLGTLSDIDSSYDTSKPITIPGAYLIHRFDKIPMVRKTDEFVRIAWLYDQGK